MHKLHYLIAVVSLPFMHCIGKRIGLADRTVVDFFKNNELNYYSFFLAVGLVCFALLWLENKYLWNKLFDQPKSNISFWVIAPGLASGFISTWTAESLVFDCLIICF